ncbi:hypothetical protein PspLS_03515 [Pyricularia sp. CBS 133598]|nr:hypothetical protein PspLS_03515 [Pyricularia sp. CBS 133598]
MHESHGLGSCEMWQGFGSKYSLTIHSPGPTVSRFCCASILLVRHIVGKLGCHKTCASISYGGTYVWVGISF